MKKLLLSIAWLGFALTAISQDAAPTIVIIRHGEKNDASGNLSCKGQHRALELPRVLNGKFRQFSNIYVPTVTPGKSTAHSRMFQTVTPTAVQDNLSVNSKYAVNNVKDLAQECLKRTGVLLVVWEHENIPDLAAALGVKDKNLKWKDSDYDSIWVITFSNSKKGNLKAALTVDKEGLNPSEACNF